MHVSFSGGFTSLLTPPSVWVEGGSGFPAPLLWGARSWTCPGHTPSSLGAVATHCFPHLRMQPVRLCTIEVCLLSQSLGPVLRQGAPSQTGHLEELQLSAGAHYHVAALKLLCCTFCLENAWLVVNSTMLGLVSRFNCRGNENVCYVEDQALIAWNNGGNKHFPDRSICPCCASAGNGIIIFSAIASNKHSLLFFITSVMWLKGSGCHSWERLSRVYLRKNIFPLTLPKARKSVPPVPCDRH